jgi:hypothetical protein
MPSMLKAVPLDVEGGFQYVRVSTYRTTPHRILHACLYLTLVVYNFSKNVGSKIGTTSFWERKELH